MKRPALLLLAISIIGPGQFEAPAQEPDIDYLGQTPPGIAPEVFGAGKISIADQRERSLAVSPIGDEMFFCRVSFPNNKIMHTVKTGIEWSLPDTAAFSEDCWTTEPAFSPDGQYLYFASSKGKSNASNYSLRRVKKVDHGWAEPESLLDLEGNTVWEFHPAVTKDATLYFAHWKNSTGDIYVSRLTGDAYSTATSVGLPVCTQYEEYGPYVDPDENYMILRSNRPGGYGDLDGYISYRKNDGTWTNPKNLGPFINTTGVDDAGDISPDGKFVFLTRDNEIYWASADFVEALRRTNFTPYLRNPIPYQTAQQDSSYRYQIPDTAFVDDDGNHTLSYAATLSNGDPLPGWLLFASATRTFSGIPPAAAAYSIKITATDTDGRKVPSGLCFFALRAGSFVQTKKAVLMR